MIGAPPRWETSSHGEAAHTRPTDLATLGQHNAQCSAASGRWVALGMDAGRMAGFLSARLMTTLAVVAALAGAVLYWR